MGQITTAKKALEDGARHLFEKAQNLKTRFTSEEPQTSAQIFSQKVGSKMADLRSEMDILGSKVADLAKKSKKEAGIKSAEVAKNVKKNPLKWGIALGALLAIGALFAALSKRSETDVDEFVDEEELEPEPANGPLPE